MSCYRLNRSKGHNSRSLLTPGMTTCNHMSKQRSNPSSALKQSKSRKSMLLEASMSNQPTNTTKAKSWPSIAHSNRKILQPRITMEPLTLSIWPMSLRNLKNWLRLSVMTKSMSDLSSKCSKSKPFSCQTFWRGSSVTGMSSLVTDSKTPRYLFNATKTCYRIWNRGMC